MHPIAQPNLMIVFSMTDDGFEGVAALLEFLLGRRDPSFLRGQNDLRIGILSAVTTILQVHMGLLGFYPRQPFDLLQNDRKGTSSF